MTYHVNTKSKDSVFRMVFRDKEKILSLYNTLNHSDYDNPDDLRVVMLENAIYMDVKNENVFVLHDCVNLCGRQHTFSPGMFLWDLTYIAKELEPLLEDDYKYSTTLIKIPTPKFAVLYNSEEKQPERSVMKLSDSFGVPDDAPALEMKATMLNINPGYNQELVAHCQTLMEYVQYVTAVRRYAKKSSIEEAVPKAVDECIEKGILRDFLLRNKAEVVAMSIFEYNEGEELKKLRAAERRGGYDEGILLAKREAVFALLEDFGEIPHGLRQKISSQQDETVLMKWLKLAAHAGSIEEFARQISQ